MFLPVSGSFDRLATSRKISTIFLTSRSKAVTLCTRDVVGARSMAGRNLFSYWPLFALDRLVYQQPIMTVPARSKALLARCRAASLHILAVVCGLAVIQYAAGGEARASHCGSYVIANPDSTAGVKSVAAQVRTEPVPHLPTPCERGQCRQAPLSPSAPPTTSSVRSTDHLLFTAFAAIDLNREQVPDFWITSARARAGFYRQLEHPPDAQPSC
jgi:hypothetical protein